MEYIAVGERELDEVMRVTGQRSAKGAVRAAMKFAARYYGRPEYARNLDLDKPHPDTLRSIEDFKAGRYSTYRTAKECFADLRAKSTGRRRNAA